MEFLVLLFFGVILGSTQGALGVSALNQEPVCSKFDYELRTLETMLRTENSVEKMKEEMEKTQKLAMKELGEIADFKAKLTDQFEEYKQHFDSQVTKKFEEMMTQEREDIAEKVEAKLQGTLAVISQHLKPDTVIAFSVTNPMKRTTKGVPTFSYIITNVGDAYDKDTGLFTSPVDGLYMFVLTVGSFTGSNTYCRIQLNGSNVVISHSHAYTYITATNAVYLLLVKGDIVSPGSCGNVENFYNNNNAFTFSGALIKQRN